MDLMQPLQYTWCMICFQRGALGMETEVFLRWRCSFNFHFGRM